MVVGMLRVEWQLEGVRSLKEKRAIVRSLVERGRRFNAAVAEVAHQDSLRTAVVGVSVVSSEQPHADAMLTEVGKTLFRDCKVVSRHTEFAHLSGERGGVDGQVLGGWDQYE